MLNDIINMVMARKGDKQIELMVDCDPNVPDRLCGDEVRIKQTVVNLLTNAVKYTTSGGVLFKISAREERYGVNLMVQVKDSGIGIKKENLGKIFGSFSQVDTKKNRSIEGSGLGLAISKCLVRDMGGLLHVKSEYGKGSEFTMVIPQKVLGEKKIICIEKKEDVNILWYIGFAKFRHSFVESTYRTILDNIGNGLDVKYLVCDTFEKTKKELEADKGYTHLFIAREEYLAEREFFNKLADKIQITVVQDRNNHVILKSSMRNIYKPFYSLPVGNVINGERLSFGGEIRHGAKERFVATKAKILVVDDNVMNLKVAIGLLKPYQMLMFTADSGKAAIEMVKKQEFDIIFMDHMMPDMDGVETLKFIRAMDGEYFKKVPIVALTANAVSGAREMFLREGFQDFVSKPIEMNAMERTLRHLLPPDKIESKEEGDGRYGK